MPWRQEANLTETGRNELDTEKAGVPKTRHNIITQLEI